MSLDHPLFAYDYKQRIFCDEKRENVNKQGEKGKEIRMDSRVKSFCESI